MAKQIRIAFRTRQEFKDRLKAVADKLGLDESTVASAAIEAVIKHVEKHGSITIPIQLVDAPKTAAPIQQGATKADAPDSPTPSTRYSLNDDPLSTGRGPGPRAKSARPGIKKTIEGK